MDDFYREFQTRFFAEIHRITGSLTELKGLVEEDKKLLAKLRKKRSMKAEQREELVLEREVIDRMAGYTSKITQLVSQKNALKQEVMQKYQKKILLDLIEMDDYEEQKNMIEKHKHQEVEQRKLKEIEEKRQKVQNMRMSKLARSFTPIKKKLLPSSASKSPPSGKGKQHAEGITTMSFKKRNVKAEITEKVELKKKKTRETMLRYDPNAQHSDYMYQRALKNHYGMEEVRFEMKARKEQEEIAEVTFHPKISDKSRQLAQNIPSFKERAFDKIEEGRRKAIQDRAKSYRKTDEKVLSSASEFKMGKEYHAHMYSKTMKWEEERKRAIESIREHKKGFEVAEIRERPNSMLKKSKELLQKKEQVEGGRHQDAHDKLYNDRIALEQKKGILKKHYDEIYSPFKPMINHSKMQSTTPEKGNHKPSLNRTTSDEILKGLLTEMKDDKENYMKIGYVKELRMPRHQKEIIKDLVVVNRYE